MSTDTLFFLGSTIVIIPFLIGLFSFKWFNIAVKLVFLFVVVGVITELASALMVKTFKASNTMPLGHFYGFVSFLAVGLFYYHVLKGFIKGGLIILVIVIYSVYYAANSIFIQSIYEYPGNTRAIGTIFILLGSILFFAKVMQETKIKNLLSAPLIWINGAFLIYYSANLFFFVLFNLMLEYSREFSKLTVIYLLGFNFLLYLLISIGFIKQRKLKME